MRVWRWISGAGRWFGRQAWWVHVLMTLGAVVLAQAIASIVGAALYVDVSSETNPSQRERPKQSEPDSAERMALARRFAPILKQHPLELFVPIDRPSYVRDTQLKQELGKTLSLLDDAPSVADLPNFKGSCVQTRGCLLFLDIRGVEPHPPGSSAHRYLPLQRHLLKTGARMTVYSHVTKYEDTGDYAVQYWFLYLFNYRLNEHESDWEQITVHLDEEKKPVNVLYSAHSGGNTLDWKSIERRGEHPVVYPALGSHANYFHPGPHRVILSCARLGSAGVCLRTRIKTDLTSSTGRTLSLGRNYQLEELTGPVFVGSYGSGNYVLLTRLPDVLSDPRLRGAWLDPLANLP